MKIGSLFIALGFDVDEKKLKSFNDGIKTARNGLFALSGVAAGAVYGINKFVSSAVSDSIALRNFRLETGYASDEIERLANVAGKANPNVGLQETLQLYKNLAQVIAQAKLGEGPLGAAGMLGAYNLPTTNPQELLDQLIRDYQANVGVWGSGDRNVINELLGQLGIGPEFMPMFQMTDAERKAAFELPIATESQRAALESMADATFEFNRQIGLLKARVGEKFAPYFTQFLEAIPPLLDKIIPSLQKFVDSLAQVLDTLITGFQGLDANWQVGIVALSTLLLSRWGPVAALFAGIAVSMDQITKFMDGQDNMISDIMKGTQQALDGEKWAKLLGIEYKVYNPAQSGIKNITNNNTFNIQSTADPQEISLEMQGVLERLNKSLMDEQGMGAIGGLR